ncbi:choice-of-anchor G family protein, partial [Microbacterium foliorum]|uniref:choice-of-anchor G family protein n=1 Tax=Microbacterium foliorum TaxID=104336 RepID=UPI0028D4EED2
MEILEGKALRRRRAIGGGIAGVTVGAVILASALIPTAANAAPGDESASSSRFLSGSLLLGGVPLDDVVSLAGVETSNNGVPTPDTDTGSLDLTALNALNLEIPGGLSVPLSGFLQLGAVNQYSQSSDAGVSRAATGAVNDSGVVDTTGGGAYPANASLNLQGLLGSTVTAAVADLDISLEAISSEVSLDGAGVVARDYNVAGGDLQLTLPAVGGLATTLTGPGGVASTVDTAVGTLAGPDGLLAGALATLDPVLGPILGDDGVEISIASNVTGALNTVLDTPVGDGVVTVNLRTGAVGADLDALLADTTGHGLNGLGVNEEVLSTAVLNNLITRVGNVLETVPTLVQTALTSTLNAATLNVNVDVCLVEVLGCVTGLQVSVPDQTLGSVVAGTATATIALTVAGLPVVIPLGTLLGALTGPLNTTLFGPTGVIATVIPTVTTAVTSIVTALDPVVGLLNGVVSLRGNVQPDNGPIYSQEAFVLTVGDVLGTGGVGTIVLAHAQAGPNALAAVVPTVDAAPAVQAGTALPVTGSGWPANTDVAVTVTAPGGGAVAGPVTLTTDGTGGFTGSVPIPVGTTPGAGFTVTATDGTSTATDTTEVTAAAAIDAAPAVQAGTDLLVSGTNWPANTQLSVQLTAPGGGANIGGPEPVTTDGSGSFTLDYPVPAGTPAAAGYTVTATVGTQTATDTTEVTDAPVAAIDAAATVQAGTNLAVSGTTWPANTLVSVQLTAPGGGANVGGPETATTNGAGEFTLAYPVPASAVPGTAYTVTATAGAVTAIDTTEVTAAAAVDAAPTVQAGTSLPLTGTGWPANTDVAVQLTAPGGGNVGGPETVTTDGTGGFTLDYPVPGGAVPGPGYTVTATVGTQTATDTTEVTAAAAVDAADTVQAGASLPITGTGWPANTDV